MRIKLWLLVLMFLLLALPTQAQGPILYFPLILKGDDLMTYKSTLGIISPYGSTNYVLNSSGETTGNFSLQGSATVTRVMTYQKYGLHSYQIATTTSGDGLNLTLFSLTAAPHYVSFRVRKAEAVRLNVTLGSATKEARLLERIDTTWSLYYATFSSAEASGQTNLRITQIGGGANTMYLDGAQVEPNKLTTYLDGTQEGCRFNGTVYASTSTRSAESRAGGVVKDFWQDYGFVVERVLGAGSVTETLNIDSYAFLPGGELNSSKIQPREFTIIGFFLGNTREDLHAKVQSLELELGLNTYPGQQPVRIRYSGARVLKEISARYTGGLEGDLPIFYNEQFSIEDDDKWQRNYTFRTKASIQFIAEDPFWYEVGESAKLLDTNDTATFRVVAARLESTGQWSNLGPPDAAGTYTTVYAMAEDATYIYIGGDFTNFNNIAAADYIVRYEKATGTYSAMAALNSIVRTIVVAPNGDVIIGGDFTNASGVAAADYIAVWAVGASAFTALGDPSSGGAAITSVFDLFFDPAGLLWVGGAFSNWSGIANADNIVTWTGAAYAAPAVGANGDVVAFAHDGTYLYVGGAYTTIGGSAIARIATWDGSAYAQPGDAISSGQVNDVVVWNNQAVIGQSASPYVSILNGQLWAALGGTGTDAAVRRLGVGPDGNLFLAGNFTAAGSYTLTDRVAKFNGYSFSHLDIDLPGTVGVQVILASEYDVEPVIPGRYTLYLGYDEPSGTGAYAGLVSANNEGTISAFPKIVFSRSGGTGATIQTLKNERTGRELLFNYALLDGESLTVDLNPKNRKVSSSFFGERIDAILANSDFSVWQLLPGENDITSFVSESGSPTVTGYLLYREAYRSWN